MLKRSTHLFILLFTASAAHAGAWLQPEGKGLLITQARYYASDSFFDVNGQKQPQQRYTKYEIQPYVEYGLTDWLTIGGSAFAQRVSQSGKQKLALPTLSSSHGRCYGKVSVRLSRCNRS